MVGQQSVLLNGGCLALPSARTGAWGMLFLLELPAEGSLAFTESEYDENVFVVRGQASIQLQHVSPSFGREQPGCLGRERWQGA